MSSCQTHFRQQYLVYSVATDTYCPQPMKIANFFLVHVRFSASLRFVLAWLQYRRSSPRMATLRHEQGR